MTKIILTLALFAIEIAPMISQDCTLSDYTFTSQIEIDEFGINFPNCHEIEGNLTVTGEDITNLHGLISITSIGSNLVIENTSLSNLEGLESLLSIDRTLEVIDNDNLIEITALKNLNKVGKTLWLDNNIKLSSLNGLHNVDLISKTEFVRVTNCLALEICEIESVCQYLTNFGAYYIGNNGEGCKNREVLIKSCAIPFDSSPRNECFYDGFEDWTPSNLPLHWEGNFGTSDEQPNVERSTSLVEGNNSILLRSNILFFEGNQNTILSMPLEENDGLIDISFTFRCFGVGGCGVQLNQGKHDSFGPNYKRIWNFIAGDSTQYSVILQNVKTDPSFDIFSSVRLIASPIWTPLGSYGVSEFVIDDFSIQKKAIVSSSIETERLHLKIYPNPANSILTIESDHTFETVMIYNILGQNLYTAEFSNEVDLGKLSAGQYLLILVDGDKMIKRTFIKN